MNDFLHAERESITNTGSESDVPITPITPPVASPSNSVQNEFGAQIEREISALDARTEPKGTPRHSLTKCACEKCQAKRVKLARSYGIAVSDNIDGEETEEDILLDEKTLAKIATVYHTYRYVSLPSPLRDAWEVSKESEEMFGRLSRKILAKYLRKADFPYKDELILGAFLASDISIRFLHEAKLKSLTEGK